LDGLHQRRRLGDRREGLGTKEDIVNSQLSV